MKSAIFFETVTNLYSERNQKFIFHDVLKSNDVTLPPESSSAHIETPELQEIIDEVLYTIHHKIGGGVRNPQWDSDEIDSYLMKVFRLSRNDLKSCQELISRKKPPVFVLHLCVIEARGLEAKDTNGFSDPYCIMGIVPGRKLKEQDETYSADVPPRSRNLLVEGEASENNGNNNTRPNQFNNRASSPSLMDAMRRSTDVNRSSVARSPFNLLGHSVRRRKSQNEPSSNSMANSQESAKNWKTLSFREGHIPVTIIKSTQVKEHTLNPVWNEQFMLEIEDILSDKLHLDIWDHDEETSVLDAVCSLNEVRGVKQFGRYLKQVSQSARKGQTGDLDDFLGCITIDLKDIPSTGLNQWFKLEGRSNKSKVQGDIHVTLNLSTQRGLNETDESSLVEVDEHYVQILRHFINYEIDKAQKLCLSWNGQITKQAEAILHQYMIQNNISELRKAMCHWITLVEINDAKFLDGHIILEALKKLIDLWNDKSLMKEEVTLLSEYFKSFNKYLIHRLTYCEHYFHPKDAKEMEQFKTTLECVQILHNSRPFQFSHPFSNTLQTDLINALKEHALQQYKVIKNMVATEYEKFDLPLPELVPCMIILATLNCQLAKIQKHYSPLFRQLVNVEPHVTSHRMFTHLFRTDYLDTNYVRDLLKKVSSNSACSNRKSFSSAETDTKLTNPSNFVYTPQILRQLFSFYFLVQIFQRVGPISKSDNDEVNEHDPLWYSWFETVLHDWVVQYAFYLNQFIDETLQNDQLNVCKTLTLRYERKATEYIGHHSQSAIMVVNNIHDILKLWQKCDWPFAQTRYIFVRSIIRTSCEGALVYAKKLHEKLRLQGYCDEQGQFDIAPQLCIGLNNMDLVAKLIEDIPVYLEWAEPISGDTFTVSDRRIPGQSIDGLKRIQQNGYTEIIRILNRTIYRMNAKMRPEIRKNVFHLCWIASSSSVEQALHDLIVYLESNLNTLHSQVSTNLFRNCILSVWMECLEQYSEQVTKEAEIRSVPVGPGAYLQLKSYTNQTDSNPGTVPLSSHKNYELVPNLPPDLDPTHILRAKTVLERLGESLANLLDFFIQASNQTLLHFDLETDEFKHVKYLIQLYNSSTPEVVEKYIIEKLEEQECTNTYPWGKLLIRISYQEPSLLVDVIKAQQLTPLDSNGLSDPFVIVELVPRHIFSTNQKTAKTRVVKNTVDPIFDERFEFNVSLDEFQNPSACLAFIVMDHDLLLSNDFEGCVFLRLATLIRKPSARKDDDSDEKIQSFYTRSESIGCLGNTTPTNRASLYTTLPLIHPTSIKYGALAILGQRSDLYAQEVYKRWKILEDSSMKQ